MSESKEQSKPYATLQKKISVRQAAVADVTETAATAPAVKVAATAAVAAVTNPAAGD